MPECMNWFGRPNKDEHIKSARIYCRGCRRSTDHALALNRESKLISRCKDCDRMVESALSATLMSGERMRECPTCATATMQYRYETRRESLYWMCSSCGREVAEQTT